MQANGESALGFWLLNFGSGDLLEKMLVLFNRWRAANNQDHSRTI